ncbi:translation elongation factor Ts [Blochmannia endosymbiont of Polyrhachis (Hedomyrma) turneri]|uniref:translation elongation factor Ts n=1 Tax=Blochmannia endosymbiont of Polyrhachis (Hedomyrma) turneri TaxID=1505596 RepID=UPI00061A77C6|nr:translation elongation factor Ts [Blochmannia endosymbiont of Polyrhachis (Hedomyrma) turneri]AKC59864.1 Elongation factor Ts [Blochmannia endosymbiont of Polyrhachis (Hedomyrma) turneri]
MSNISSELIKELRERTNVGIMKCKQALINANGNIQLAIDNMKENGLIKAAKKSGKITKSGIVLTKISPNKRNGIILEINCETDFVSKNDKFNNFANIVAATALEKNISDINVLKNHFMEKQNILISIFDENIKIRRIAYIEGEMIGSYLHNQKIGVILSTTNCNTNSQLIKHIAMHIAANKPEYIDVHHIPTNIIEHEKNIQMNLAIQSGKTNDVAKKIVEGRIKKFVNEISLLNQIFIMDTQKTIANILKNNNINITHFIRFELGEGIKTTN